MYIGIDLGGTNIAAGVVDETGHIIYKSSVLTLAQRPIDEIVEDMANLCIDVVNGADRQISEIRSVGVGCPGTVDNKSGVIAYSCNLKMKNTELRAMLEKKLGKPVNLENDANAAALGEYAVNGDNADSFVLITLGTGVGGGVIIDGKPYRGFNCAGGELGHIIINAEGEEECSCGNKGCWEAYASANALIRMTKEAIMNENAEFSYMLKSVGGDINKVNGKTPFDAMLAGDATGKEVINKYIGYLATGLVNIVNIFQPDIICIGGGVCRQGENLLAPVRAIVEKERITKYNEKQTVICTASLGNDAGIIGAAML